MHGFFKCSLLVLPCSMLPAAAYADAKPQPGKQVEQVIVSKSNEEDRLGYLLFLPADYGKAKKTDWPLILFLHGAGERGEENLPLVKKHGPPKIVEKDAKFPYIVVSPQCPKRKRWSDGVRKKLLIELLDKLSADLDVDEDRVYLTGLSIGGYGSWALAADHPQRFAAVVPICGGGDPKTAEKLKPLPIWVFHGGKDNAVPIEGSQKMMDALKALGSDVKFTIYPDAGHDSWTETYANPKLYDWLAKQKRSAKKTK